MVILARIQTIGSQEGLAGIFGVPERYVDSITFKMLEELLHRGNFSQNASLQKIGNSQNSGKDHRLQPAHFSGVKNDMRSSSASGVVTSWPWCFVVWDEILASYIGIMIGAMK